MAFKFVKNISEKLFGRSDDASISDYDLFMRKFEEAEKNDEKKNKLKKDFGEDFDFFFNVYSSFCEIKKKCKKLSDKNKSLSKSNASLKASLESLSEEYSEAEQRIQLLEKRISGYKKVVVLSRKRITNYGDPIIADCCAYLAQNAAEKAGVNCLVRIVDINESDKEKLRVQLSGTDILIYPGGGLNSVKFNKKVISVLDVLDEVSDAKVFFNAIGILKVDPNPDNEKLLVEILNRPNVCQVTTRGDFPQLKKYLTSKQEFPPEWILDPAVWSGETYGISKNEQSDVIGVGVIRSDIFEANKNDFSPEDVFEMYEGILRELDRRGMKWQLFVNGMKDDFKFGVRLLERMNIEVSEERICSAVVSPRSLVEVISGYKAVIAARLHANIISTALAIPSVALVWNDKMNLFGEIIGSEENYIKPEKLKKSQYIVDRLEEAIRNGYNLNKIDAEKEKTLTTFDNIFS